MSWKSLEDQEPALAAFGAQRLNAKVAYMATIRKDGSPRVHPLTPIIGEGHLFIFMEPTSPKGHDLERDGRYAMHCGVTDSTGESGEFFISGYAHRVDDLALRQTAARLSSYAVADRYILFEFGVQAASSTVYQKEGPVRRAWRAAG